MFKFDETMYGRKVRLIDPEMHEELPRYYPPVGTIGTIVHNEESLDIFEDGSSDPLDWQVQWPEGITVGDGRWYVDEECIELVEEDNDENG